MKMHVNLKQSAWLDAIKQGADQLDRGEGIAYSPAVLEHITQSAIAAMHGSQPMNPDVCP